MSERFQVRVTKDYLVFCCAHFISYQGDQCERLHGHNYRVAVEVEGALDGNHYVFDFITLKNRTRELVDELDHRMLIALNGTVIQAQVDHRQVRLTYRDREWIFPREDCALLPIENTTAELLAKYLAGRLREVLAQQHRYHPEVIRVEVEEAFGQWAKYEHRV
ncbi:MAG: 6-carboxytetrahydropterin synthase [Gemmataceae bacterium]